MTTHQIEIHDGATPQDSTTPQIKADVRKYRVTAEAGIFKRGKLWAKDELIELERKTALNFIAVGEVEEVL